MVRIQNEDFDSGTVIDELKSAAGDCGAIVSFTGLVRGSGENASTRAITLEHYPGMTEKALNEIVASACNRWHLAAVSIIHRVGTLKVGEQIVLVATASAHRQDAFESAQYIMDYLKTEAPFWKKEHTDLGDHWVEEKQSDVDAKRRWSSES